MVRERMFHMEHWTPERRRQPQRFEIVGPPERRLIRALWQLVLYGCFVWTVSSWFVDRIGQ